MLCDIHSLTDIQTVWKMTFTFSVGQTFETYFSLEENAVEFETRNWQEHSESGSRKNQICISQVS